MSKLTSEQQQIESIIIELIEKAGVTPKSNVRRHDIYEKIEDTLGLEQDFTEIDFVLDWMIKNNIINVDYSLSYMNPVLELNEDG